MFTIINADCKQALKTLDKNSVACVVTSPPYFNCRTYGSDQHEIGREETPYKFIRALCDVLLNIKDILKDDGVVWLNIGDCIAKKNYAEEGTISMIKKGEQMLIPTLFALQARRDGWYVQQDIIWAKTNPMPCSSKKRCTPSHEYIFMLTKQYDYNFDPSQILVDAKTNYKGKAQPPIGGVKKSGGDNSSYSGNTPEGTGKARKRDVWFETTSKCPEAHFAPFPKNIVEPCILACTNENDIVLDPFCGTGTTGHIAYQHNRKFIGIELYSNYIDIILKKCDENNITAKIINEIKPELEFKPSSIKIKINIKNK